MKYLSCNEAGFMSLSCELTCVTYETLKCDGVVSYIWRCRRLGQWLGFKTPTSQIGSVSLLVHVYVSSLVHPPVTVSHSAQLAPQRTLSCLFIVQGKQSSKTTSFGYNNKPRYKPKDILPSLLFRTYYLHVMRFDLQRLSRQALSAVATLTQSSLINWPFPRGCA